MADVNPEDSCENATIVTNVSLESNAQPLVNEDCIAQVDDAGTPVFVDENSTPSSYNDTMPSSPLTDVTAQPITEQANVSEMVDDPAIRVQDNQRDIESSSLDDSIDHFHQLSNRVSHENPSRDARAHQSDHPSISTTTSSIHPVAQDSSPQVPSLNDNDNDDNDQDDEHLSIISTFNDVFETILGQDILIANSDSSNNDISLTINVDALMQVLMNTIPSLSRRSADLQLLERTIQCLIEQCPLLSLSMVRRSLPTEPFRIRHNISAFLRNMQNYEGGIGSSLWHILDVVMPILHNLLTETIQRRQSRPAPQVTTLGARGIPVSTSEPSSSTTSRAQSIWDYMIDRGINALPVNHDPYSSDTPTSHASRPTVRAQLQSLLMRELVQLSAFPTNECCSICQESSLNDSAIIPNPNGIVGLNCRLPSLTLQRGITPQHASIQPTDHLHVFHLQCLLDHMTTTRGTAANRCPTCRHPILVQEDFLQLVPRAMVHGLDGAFLNDHTGGGLVEGGMDPMMTQFMNFLNQIPELNIDSVTMMRPGHEPTVIRRPPQARPPRHPTSHTHTHDHTIGRADASSHSQRPSSSSSSTTLASSNATISNHTNQVAALYQLPINPSRSERNTAPAQQSRDSQFNMYDITNLYTNLVRNCPLVQQDVGAIGQDGRGDPMFQNRANNPQQLRSVLAQQLVPSSDTEETMVDMNQIADLYHSQAQQDDQASEEDYFLMFPEVSRNSRNLNDNDDENSQDEAIDGGTDVEETEEQEVDDDHPESTHPSSTRHATSSDPSSSNTSSLSSNDTNLNRHHIQDNHRCSTDDCTQDSHPTIPVLRSNPSTRSRSTRVAAAASTRYIERFRSPQVNHSRPSSSLPRRRVHFDEYPPLAITRHEHRSGPYHSRSYHASHSRHYNDHDYSTSEDEREGEGHDTSSAHRTPLPQPVSPSNTTTSLISLSLLSAALSIGAIAGGFFTYWIQHWK